MIKILANDGIHQDGLTLFRRGWVSGRPRKKLLRKTFHRFLPDYDVIIVRSATKVRKDLIDQCPKIKDYCSCWCRTG